MNIEEIKVRLSNLDAGKVVKYDNAMNLATQYMVDYKNDVEYLLFITKQAEKALVDIEHISSPRIYDFAINQLAWKALQVIRGEITDTATITSSGFGRVEGRSKEET